MALIGISLILASVIYVAIRRPPLIETLLALWRGDPKIEQPPTTRTPPPSSSSSGPRSQSGDDGQAGEPVPDASATSSTPAIVVGADTGETSHRAAMHPSPLPPPAVIRKENGSASCAAECSPQTTPKASATQINDSGVPTFTLSPEPPASAAAVARSQSVSSSSSSPPSISSSTTATATTTNASLPSLSGAPSSAPPLAAVVGSASSSMLMPPPPARPPTLAPLSSSGSAATPGRAPGRTSQAQLARQPGSSTLAPPPTHSAKPTKPSRKVTLEPGCSPLDWARLAQSPTSDLRGLPPGTPYLRVPPSLLKRQNGRRGRDAWSVLGGRVYNITPYLRFHPGGEAELLRGAGRDGTRLFGEVHPWVNYEAMLASCLVGVLVAEGEEGGAGGAEMEEMD
ncbi:hypothetical protein DL766_001668 [Monosporascus sp. MC13-8B]|uniref:Cytochrome b5 heme-binding domain-containing protein n=1 Tax=Monosporascus cannonballus TaxID=155416 RepID=A0ABY0H9E8_9PEZI|nr:hypothetical protein DL762_005435 [Monosporascus cannonballus]RYO91909.1 hypothetical protein DL763_004847 [Monosporascus cannonballus]RYP37094.1 hypothetical protein DL766_001668 [Monosporascus sp. MC13-8B]